MQHLYHDKNNNGRNWELSTCSCHSFAKEYICKHILGIASLRNFFTLLDEANSDLIGKRRGQGRPKKVNRALVVA